MWTEQRAGWATRARGWLRVMRLDAFVSMIIYTLATIAFYVLGAAVLHKTARNVTDDELIGRLADMYHRSLGDWSHALFLVGALAVLYSTFFVATASNARLLVDIGGLLGVPAAATPTAEARRKAIQACCVFLPLASAAAYVIWPQPVTLVLIGAVGQGLMLPLLGFAAVYFRHRRHPRRPGTERRLDRGAMDLSHTDRLGRAPTSSSRRWAGCRPSLLAADIAGLGPSALGPGP